MFGKPTLHPLPFYSGKIAGYATWIYLALVLSGHNPFEGEYYPSTRLAALILAGAGIVISGLSLINLGRSTRFGLPTHNTRLKVHGIYRFSRNPMYTGFDLLTLASMVITFSPPVIIAGAYSIVIYHLIIKGEERFLESKFESEYNDYKSRTRRYL